MVLANRRPLANLVGQALVGQVVFGDDEQAGRVFVQTMYDAGAHRAADPRQAARAMRQQGIHQSSRLRAGCGMDHQPFGLVDDNQIVVFVDDVERDIFCLGLFERPCRGKIHDDFIAGPQAITCFTGFFVDGDRMGSDQPLNMGAGDVRQTFGQKDVQTRLVSSSSTCRLSLTGRRPPSAYAVQRDAPDICGGRRPYPSERPLPSPDTATAHRSGRAPPRPKSFPPARSP